MTIVGRYRQGRGGGFGRVSEEFSNDPGGGIDALIATALSFAIYYYIVEMNGLELSPLAAAGIGAVIAFAIRLVRHAFFDGKKDEGNGQ